MKYTLRESAASINATTQGCAANTFDGSGLLGERWIMEDGSVVVTHERDED